MRALLLPGLHGTGDLFDDFRDALVPGIDATALSFPKNEDLDYDDLLSLCTRALPGEPFVLVAESFAGPLAIRIAARRPPHLVALVLVATFARVPRSWIKLAPWTLLNSFFAVSMPDFMLRAILAGNDASSSDVATIGDAIASVPSHVLATRVRAIANVDARPDLKKVNVPMLYLRGRRDRLVPPSALLDLLLVRPDIETRILDAPHLVLQRRPHEAAASIARFMRDFAPKSPPQEE